MRTGSGATVPCDRQHRIAGEYPYIGRDFGQVGASPRRSEIVVGPSTAVESVVLEIGRSELNDILPTVVQLGDVELAYASSTCLCRPLERVTNRLGCVSPSDVIGMIRADIPLH